MLAPPKVSFEGIAVKAGYDRIIIEPEHPRLDCLRKAMEIGVRALRELPETPVSAAGINLAFSLEDEGIVESLNLCVANDYVDSAISELDGLPIRKSSISRTVEWGDGVINVAFSRSHRGELGALQFSL